MAANDVADFYTYKRMLKEGLTTEQRVEAFRLRDISNKELMMLTIGQILYTYSLATPGLTYSGTVEKISEKRIVLLVQDVRKYANPDLAKDRWYLTEREALEKGYEAVEKEIETLLDRLVVLKDARMDAKKRLGLGIA